MTQDKRWLIDLGEGTIVCVSGFRDHNVGARRAPRWSLRVDYDIVQPGRLTRWKIHKALGRMASGLLFKRVCADNPALANKRGFRAAARAARWLDGRMISS